MPKSGVERDRPQIELEPAPKYPVIVTGATSPTGCEIVRALSHEGFIVGIGNRSKEKFRDVASELDTNVSYFSFEADLTDVDQIKHAVDKAQNQFGMERVHLVHAAAAGLPKRRELLVPLLALRRQDVITPEQAKEAKAKIAAILAQEDVREEAWQVNSQGPWKLVAALANSGLLRKTSRVFTTSSPWSDNWLMNNGSSALDYDGPTIYANVARYKAQFVQQMESHAKHWGYHFIDIVIPEIEETPTGDFVENNFLPLVQKANPDKKVEFAKVSKERVGRAVLEALQGTLLDGSTYVHKLYVTDRETTSVKPPEMNQRFVYPL